MSKTIVEDMCNAYACMHYACVNALGNVLRGPQSVQSVPYAHVPTVDTDEGPPSSQMLLRAEEHVSKQMEALNAMA